MAAANDARDERPAIRTERLGKTYNGLVAVDGIDLSVGRGEMFALLGANGAGKTTTISMLCCLLRPSGGTASIMGYDINRQPFKIKELIGVSPQETAISEHLNVLENLELIGKMHGMDAAVMKKRAGVLLEAMGLAERAKDQVRKFSGGMKRRLSIMMALIHDPEVLFLDEPTLGLDPQARRSVWEYIAGLKGEKTIMLTTHYMEEADFLAGRIGIMDEGKIVALGTARELKMKTQDKTTMVVAALNVTEKAVGELQERYAAVSVAGDMVQITDAGVDFKEIVDRFQSSGATVRSAYIKEPTLDDVFLNITGKELRE